LFKSFKKWVLKPVYYMPCNFSNCATNTGAGEPLLCKIYDNNLGLTVP
jgi:hypothetical protein